MRASGDPALRREWRRRVIDHDGEAEGDGGIARWLHLAAGLGLDRDLVVSTRGILPCDAICGRGLCAFLSRADLARSDRLIAHRIVLASDHRRTHRGMLKHYDFVTADTLAYFTKRPPQAQRDSDFALD